MVLKLDTPVLLTPRLRNHMKKRSENKKNWRRGKKGRRFVALDEALVFEELFSMCAMELVMDFVCDGLNADAVHCVCAQWVWSNSVNAQLLHRDHTYGYGKYMSMLIGFDGFVIDTLILERCVAAPANCHILVFDSYDMHAGGPGTNFSKLLVSFAVPSIPEFSRIAHQNLHKPKRNYPLYCRAAVER